MSLDPLTIGIKVTDHCEREKDDSGGKCEARSKSSYLSESALGRKTCFIKANSQFTLDQKWWKDIQEADKFEILGSYNVAKNLQVDLPIGKGQLMQIILCRYKI